MREMSSKGGPDSAKSWREAFNEAPEAHAARIEVVDSVNEVLEAATQPVEAPHD